MSFVSSPAVLATGYRSSQSQEPSTPSSAARTAPITLKGKEAPIKFVVHEIVKILARHRRPLHTLEVEKALRNIGFDGVNISTHRELCALLAANKLVEFNETTKRLAYRNRYESVVSQESLLTFVAQNAGHRGVRVTPELLANAPGVAGWINELLRHRKLRAIRSNASHLKGTWRSRAGRKKCRYVGTPNQCSLYASSKCHECLNNLEGVLLFPLGRELFEAERYKLDHDIKGLWDSVGPAHAQVSAPPGDQLLRDYNIAAPVPVFQPAQPERRKRKESKGYAPVTRRFKLKMRKIYNTHLFTPQELREGVTLQ